MKRRSFLQGLLAAPVAVAAGFSRPGFVTLQAAPTPPVPPQRPASLAMFDELTTTAVAQRLAAVSPHDFRPSNNIFTGDSQVGDMLWSFSRTLQAGHWTPVVAEWDVDVTEGNVTLSGTAPDDATRNRIIAAVRTVPGVINVDASDIAVVPVLFVPPR